MIRYADPEACPACRSHIARGASTCSTCAVPLAGSVARTLFGTLTEADGMVAELRRMAADTTPALLATADAVSGTVSGTTPRTRAGSADLPRRRTTGLTAASGPKILLGLGALCLLVAAVVFLAVAWSELGVGGRTGVLVGLTATAAGIAATLVRKGLRAGSEAFTTVALGLLVVDLFGADSAGWFGDLGADGFAILVGAVAGFAGLGVAWAASLRRLGGLISAQVIGGLGVLVATVGTWSAAEQSVVVVLLMALTAAFAVAANRFGLAASTLVLGLGAAAWWLVLLADGLARIDDAPTIANLWSGLQTWPVLVCAAAVSTLAAVRAVPQPARVAAAAIAVGLLVGLVTVPVVDEDALSIAVVALVVLAACVAASLRLPSSWRWTVSIPWAVAATVEAAYVVTHGLHSLALHVEHRTWSGPLDTTLSTGFHHTLVDDQPLLLPVAVTGVLLAVWVGSALVALGNARGWGLPHAVAGGLAVLGSLALLPAALGAPAYAVIGLLAVYATTATIVAIRAEDVVTRLPAALLGAGGTGLAVGVALVNDVLTALATGAVAVATVALVAQRSRVGAFVGGAVFAPAAAASLWSVLHLLDVDAAWRGVPVLVVIGAWAIVGARLEREATVTLTATVVTACSLLVAAGEVGRAGDVQAWLAVDLTVAGVLVAVSALCNAHRRRLGWLSLALLTLAQWVRLDQVGITAVEAYTLPLAVVLLLVGVLTMRRTPISSFRALTSGLVLALTPSLTVALADPVSLRALLLGIACALVVIAGSALRWSAPLVIGAGVGLVLVLREVGHADVLPQWVVIGLVGLALTTLGVTWERSLAGARAAAARLHRMR